MIISRDLAKISRCPQMSIKWYSPLRWEWFLKGQTTSDETVRKIFITKQIILHNFALPVFFSTRQYVTSSLITHNSLSILAEFGRFFLNDFGIIDSFYSRRWLPLYGHLGRSRYFREITRYDHSELGNRKNTYELTLELRIHYLDIWRPF